MTSSQEMEQVYSYNPGARMRHHNTTNCSYCSQSYIALFTVHQNVRKINNQKHLETTNLHQGRWSSKILTTALSPKW